MVYLTFVGMNSARLLSTKRSPTKKPMKVISLEEYRKAKRIQVVLKKQENVESTRDKLVNLLAEKLRQRLRKRMRLQELEKKQSKPPTKKTPI